MDSLVKKVLLVGNPNVGKSLVFSRITGLGIISANYPGTTVELKIGRFKFRDQEYELMDVPGTYSLETFSKAEETAVGLIDESDIIINVVDATNLERNLNLTLQLLKKNKPIIVCLNFWDETAHKGIGIDSVALENILTVPVVTTCALSGEGIKKLISQLDSARVGNLSFGKEEQWCLIGSITNRVQKLTHRHHTFLERLSDFTLHPLGGIVSAVAMLVLTFIIVRFIGEGLLNYVCTPIFSQLYHPIILKLSAFIPVDFIKGVLAGHTSDPLESFGILTTGVYIALVLVFPYFFSFYFVLGLLEDFGYLPRLAIVLDTFFHRMGLHGYSSIPVILGFGCKVPAFLATRVMVNKREKILTIALILMCAPCLPQSAMIFSLGMHYGTLSVVAIFATLFIQAIGVNLLLNKLLKGETSELFIEIPPYRKPQAKLLLSKLRFRIVDYLKEVFPMIVAGVLVINILDFLKIFDLISDFLGKPIVLLLGLPHEIASVMILGFLRKDVSIALLAPFNLTARQFVIASIFMVLYVPCIASFFTLIKENGARTTLKIVGAVFVFGLVITSLLNAAFTAVHRIALF